MPRYFFNLVSPGEYSADEVGVELAGAEAAFLQAHESALEMSFEMLRGRTDPSRHVFEITDAKGTVLFELPFSEVTRPAQHPAPLRRVHASIERHRQRTHRIQSELATGIDQTRSLLEQTRALLARR